MSNSVLPPLPTAELEVEPTAEEVQFFDDNGFLVVERLTTDEEIDWLTEVYERIFDPANADLPGAPVSRSGVETDDAGSPLLRQAFMPEFHYPQLLQTVYNRNARRYAAALLQVDADRLSSWGHMIRKAPGGCAAPWHQDEAYWEKELRYHALGVWLPMHEVTEDMGAMQFVAGSHKRGVLSHVPQGGDVARHLLEAAIDIDPGQVVPCPLPKGGATFHHQRTLHFTAVNQTDRPRLAFPTEFQVAPVRREVPADRPWVDDFRTALDRQPSLETYPADGVLAKI